MKIEHEALLIQEERNGKTITALQNDFATLRAGRANPQLRDSATFKRMNESDDWLAGMETGYKWKVVETAGKNDGSIDLTLNGDLQDWLNGREFIALIAD